MARNIVLAVRWQFVVCVLALGCNSSQHNAAGAGGTTAANSVNPDSGASPVTTVASGTGGVGMALGAGIGGAVSAGSGGGGASAGTAGGGATGGSGGAGGAASTSGDLREVLLVGNSVSGTVSVIDGQSFQNLGSVNVIPDLQARLDEINANPVAAIGYSGVKAGQTVKHFEPSGGDRFVDDVFVSPDGKTLYVSRSNLADVAAFDLSSATHPQLWRTHVDGIKADHATLSPDGTKLVVSATTVDMADVLDAKTGAIVTTFPTGHIPHQNDYSADGKHLYNGSIGDVGLPHAQDAQKGVRQLTVVDGQTFTVIKTYPFMEGIRPTVITADEKTMYAQQSYLNGLIEFDLTTGMIVKTLDEPLSDFAKTNYPTMDDYPHDSAHHGLAMSGDGSKLCDAGTIDNTVSIVSTADLTVSKVIDVGLVPYWATTSADGKYCFVSLSGDGAVSVIDYDKAAQVTQVKVGKFPQRSRRGRLRASDVALLLPAGG